MQDDIDHARTAREQPTSATCGGADEKVFMTKARSIQRSVDLLLEFAEHIAGHKVRNNNAAIALDDLDDVLNGCSTRQSHKGSGRHD
ncbi:hypothetical protein D3C72_1860500 [compost metagenome]